MGASQQVAAPNSASTGKVTRASGVSRHRRVGNPTDSSSQFRQAACRGSMSSAVATIQSETTRLDRMALERVAGVFFPSGCPVSG